MSRPERVEVAGLHPELGDYSHAVAHDGRLLQVSGQAPVTPDGTTVTGGIGPQAEQVMDNLMMVLAAAGAGAADVVKLTTYLVDAADAAAFAGVRRTYFAPPYPASTVVVVATLLDATWRLEVDAVVALP